MELTERTRTGSFLWFYFENQWQQLKLFWLPSLVLMQRLNFLFLCGWRTGSKTDRMPRRVIVCTYQKKSTNTITCTYIHICIYRFIHTYIYAYTYVYIYIPTHVYTRTHGGGGLFADSAPTCLVVPAFEVWSEDEARGRGQQRKRLC